MQAEFAKYPGDKVSWPLIPKTTVSQVRPKNRKDSLELSFASGNFFTNLTYLRYSARESVCMPCKIIA